MPACAPLGAGSSTEAPPQKLHVEFIVGAGAAVPHANGFPHVRARVLGVDWRWRVADPTIVNSTTGHLPVKPLVVFPREDESAGLGSLSDAELLALDRVHCGGPLSDCAGDEAAGARAASRHGDG